jgi:hypothetical protein
MSGTEWVRETAAVVLSTAADRLPERVGEPAAAARSRLTAAESDPGPWPAPGGRSLVYRAHAALRARNGIGYADRGPARHARRDMLRLPERELSALVGVDPSPACPGRLSRDPLIESDLAALREWRERERTRRRRLRDDLGDGAKRGARLKAAIGPSGAGHIRATPTPEPGQTGTDGPESSIGGMSDV